MPKPAKTRTCLSCRNEFDKSELLRFVVDPNNNVILDLYGKAPARGSYVCHDEACLTKTLGKSILPKMLKANSGTNLLHSVKESLKVKIKGDLLMLKKSQLFVPGADQTTELARVNKAAFILFASNISPKSKEKILFAIERNETEHLTMFSKNMLSTVLGIANCSVLAFKRSKLTTSLKNTLKVYEKVEKL